MQTYLKTIVNQKGNLAMLVAKIFFMILALLCVYVVCLGKAMAITVPAKASILIDVASGKVLYGSNQHEKLPPASTTKIVTALLVLESLDLNQVLTVPKDFVNDGEAGIWLEAGEKQTVEALLMAMLLRSANDAAQMLAIGVSGSVEEFAQLMNQKAQDLGLQDSHFVNANGLHREEHYTSAYDLAMLSREAVRNPEFNRIIVTPQYQLPWVVGEYDRVVYNRNTLLDIYPEADGIKNGYTKEAGNCLVSSATKDGNRLIAVVFNCSDMYNSSKALLEYGFENFYRTDVCMAEEVKGTVAVKAGKQKSVQAVTQTALSTVLKKEVQSEFKETIQLSDSVTAPIKKGQVLGTVTYTNTDGEELTTNLISAEKIISHNLPLVFYQIWQSVWQVFVVPINK